MVKKSGKLSTKSGKIGTLIGKIINKIGENWNFHIFSIDTASAPASGVFYVTLHRAIMFTMFCR